MYAAGMTLEEENLKEFRTRFEQVVAKQITEEILTPRVNIDQPVNFDLLNYKFYKILKQMEELKPHFYPQRMEVKVVERISRLIARPDLPHLSRVDLGQLWSKAGDFLHRGKMVNLGKGEDIVKSLKPIESTPENFPDIFEWSGKITGILNCHWITLTEDKNGMFVTLKSPDTERVTASIFDFNTESMTLDVSSLKFGEFK